MAHQAITMQAGKQVDDIDAKSSVAKAGQTLQQADAIDLKVNPVVIAQLSKTKMCTKFAKGNCHDPNCPFAHSKSELRSRLDLSKTAMCRMFAKGMCSNDNCKFAHSEQELRVTQNVFKTQLCNFYKRGHCKKGNQCRHAHGVHELRSVAPPDSPTASEDTRCPSDVSTDGDVTPKDSARGVALMATVPALNALPPFPVPRPTTPVLPPPALVQSIAKSIPETSEPMKVALPPLSLPPLSSKPLVEMMQQRQPLFAQNRLSNPIDDQMVWFDEAAKNSEVQLRAATGPTPDIFGDGFTNRVGQAAGQMVYAHQMAKAAELELQMAFVKAQLQMKQAVEIAAVAEQIDNSMAHVNAMPDIRSRAMLGNAHSMDDLRAAGAKLALPPGLY